MKLFHRKTSDPHQAKTQPTHILPETQPFDPTDFPSGFYSIDPIPTPLQPGAPQRVDFPVYTHPNPYPARPTRKRRFGCCGCLVIPAILVLGLLAVYCLYPGRTNVLLLGIDARPEEGNTARSDTMILATFMPARPYVGALSIPRDLWVEIPGHGQNRINTAHFFGEIDHPGSGPQAAMQAVRTDFGVNVDYFMRIRFDGFREIVDAMGGVDMTLPSAMSGYEAGKYHFNGTQALALVRDRESSDDFFRMQRGQIFIKAVIQQMLKPSSLVRLPVILAALPKALTTDVPVWLWPRLGMALLRVGTSGLDGRTITREMVTPFTTSGGAQVLGPRWDRINPVLLEMFGQ